MTKSPSQAVPGTAAALTKASLLGQGGKLSRNPPHWRYWDSDSQHLDLPAAATTEINCSLTTAPTSTGTVIWFPGRVLPVVHRASMPASSPKRKCNAIYKCTQLLGDGTPRMLYAPRSQHMPGRCHRLMIKRRRKVLQFPLTQPHCRRQCPRSLPHDGPQNLGKHQPRCIGR